MHDITIDGVGPIAIGLQNRTDEVIRTLRSLGVEDDATVMRVISAMMNLNSRCRVVSVCIYTLVVLALW